MLPSTAPPPPHTQGCRDSHSSIAKPSLVDLVVRTITSCHTETSPDSILLQVVRVLLALVLSLTILPHQSSLLKAVRTVYNVFLMSNDAVNQTVAQGGPHPEAEPLFEDMPRAHALWVGAHCQFRACRRLTRATRCGDVATLTFGPKE
jgi:hypothetical protein